MALQTPPASLPVDVDDGELAEWRDSGGAVVAGHGPEAGARGVGGAVVVAPAATIAPATHERRRARLDTRVRARSARPPRPLAIPSTPLAKGALRGSTCAEAT